MFYQVSYIKYSFSGVDQFLINMLVTTLLGIISPICLSLSSYGCDRLQVDSLLTVHSYYNYQSSAFQ
jgi:hypothetical protein